MTILIPYIIYTLSQLLEIMTLADSKPEQKNVLFCWLIINKPQPKLYSGDTFPGPEGVPWIKVPQYLSIPPHPPFPGIHLLLGSNFL